MPVNPSDIIDRQLELLKVQSDKGTITFEEAQTLERLIRMQILLKMKSGRDPSAEACEEISTEELKALLPLLDPPEES